MHKLYAGGFNYEDRVCINIIDTYIMSVHVCILLLNKISIDYLTYLYLTYVEISCTYSSCSMRALYSRFKY